MSEQEAPKVKKPFKHTEAYLKKKAAKIAGQVALSQATPPPSQVIPTNENALPPIRSTEQLERFSTEQLAAIATDRKIPLKGGDYNIVVALRRINEGSFAGLWEFSTLRIEDGKVIEKKVMIDATVKQSILGVAYKLLAYCQ